MSRGPSRFDTKYRCRPSRDQAGLRLDTVRSATVVSSPPATGATTIALGATLPKPPLEITPPKLPDAQAIQSLRGDQSHECSWYPPLATTRSLLPSSAAIASALS